MAEELLVRTTTAIERHWGEGKRILREVQGCKKLRVLLKRNLKSLCLYRT
jgi:hypothetical protein